MVTHLVELQPPRCLLNQEVRYHVMRQPSTWQPIQSSTSRCKTILFK